MIYIEKSLSDHPRARKICQQFPKKSCIPITHYGEIFNRHSQNFRMQKKRPALILARKEGKLLYETPKTYTIGAPNNYYFSHVLNCPFDCRYCFLQGMYRSAHYVLFVNYEDFQEEIKKKAGKEKTTFFSGYDGDSLALEYCTGFLDSFVPFFATYPQMEIEIRTKSIAIQPLLKKKAIPNAVIAYSVNPAPIIKAFESKTASLKARLRAICALQERGWQIGLRFDPILLVEGFEKHYRYFFQTLFSTLSLDSIHSVTLGTFRLPKAMHKAMEAILPKEPLLAQCTLREGNKMGLSKDKEEELLAFCYQEINRFIEKEKIYRCQ